MIACVLVVNADANVALNKPAIQSSTYGTAVASLAVDGVAGDAACTMIDVPPWLVIDLEAEYRVGHVVVIFNVDPHSNY